MLFSRYRDKWKPDIREIFGLGSEEEFKRGINRQVIDMSAQKIDNSESNLDERRYIIFFKSLGSHKSHQRLNRFSGYLFMISE